jgi:hypothetical protein
LESGQYDGHNNTLSDLSEYEGVHVMNLIWEEYWSDNDFFDQNHLDRHGRQTFCEATAPRISEILEG